MRFKEFKLYLKEDKAKVYAIGDSHAVAVANAGNFVNLATNGRSAMSTDNDGAISQVDPGSVVVLSAGANDMLNPNKSSVASRVVSLIDKLKQKQCKVYYILFAETDNPKYSKDRNSLRSIVSTAVGDKASIIDMGKLSYKEGSSDGIHAPMGWYASAAQQVKNGAGNVSAKEVKKDPARTDGETVASLAVPNGRVGPEVADVQKALVALGYPLPKHGVDGVRGSETSNAVKAFQQDAGLTVDGDPGPDTVGALNKVMKQKGITIKKSTQADVKGNVYGGKDIEDEDIKKLDPLPDSKDSQNARASADSYLGRKMSDDEWNYLLRATAAESSFNKEEYAMVMGSILNRARDYGKNGVISALMAPNQFQAVTGTAVDGHKPSPNFTRGPNNNQMKMMLHAAVNILPKVSHSQRNFTAANPAAYGPGTNIGYLHSMVKQGGSQIGGTVFNTALATA